MQFPGAVLVDSLLIIKTTLSMMPVVLKCFDLSYLSSCRSLSPGRMNSQMSTSSTLSSEDFSSPRHSLTAVIPENDDIMEEVPMRYPPGTPATVLQECALKEDEAAGDDREQCPVVEVDEGDGDNSACAEEVCEEEQATTTTATSTEQSQQSCSVKTCDASVDCDKNLNNNNVCDDTTLNKAALKLDTTKSADVTSSNTDAKLNGDVSSCQSDSSTRAQNSETKSCDSGDVNMTPKDSVSNCGDDVTKMDLLKPPVEKLPVDGMTQCTLDASGELLCTRRRRITRKNSKDKGGGTAAERNNNVNKLSSAAASTSGAAAASATPAALPNQAAGSAGSASGPASVTSGSSISGATLSKEEMERKMQQRRAICNQTIIVDDDDNEITQ